MSIFSSSSNFSTYCCCLTREDIAFNILMGADDESIFIMPTGSVPPRSECAHIVIKQSISFVFALNTSLMMYPDTYRWPRTYPGAINTNKYANKVNRDTALMSICCCYCLLLRPSNY